MTFNIIKVELKIIAMIALLLLAVIMSPTKAYADSPPQGLGFYVQTVLPENQRASGKSYFDIRVSPGDKQEIYLEIGNTSDEPIVLHGQINNAYTNSAGDVDYNLHGIKDSSLTYSVEDVASLEQSEFRLAPGEVIRTRIFLDMPEEEFSGEIIGGIYFKKEHNEEQNLEKNISIVNIYSHVTGIVISEKDSIIEPDFQLTNVEPALANHRVAAIHTIRNSEPVLVDNVKLEIEVFTQGDPQPIWQLVQEQIKMAPSSSMDYIFYLDDTEIVPGKYSSHITMTWQEKEWKFEEKFEIFSEEANTINKQSARFSEEQSENQRTVLILIVVILIIILLFLLLLVKSILMKEKHIIGDEDEGGL